MRIRGKGQDILSRKDGINLEEKDEANKHSGRRTMRGGPEAGGTLLG